MRKDNWLILKIQEQMEEIHGGTMCADDNLDSHLPKPLRTDVCWQSGDMLVFNEHERESMVDFPRTVKIHGFRASLQDVGRVDTVRLEVVEPHPRFAHDRFKKGEVFSLDARTTQRLYREEIRSVPVRPIGVRQQALDTVAP